MSALTNRRGARASLGVVASLGLAAALAVPALAGETSPIPVSDDNNPTCGDFDDQYAATWVELKIDPPKNGTATDGTLEVTISNFSNTDPKGFDWESNIGVDAVLVKAGSDKHHLYVYDPEATSDEGLTPQSGPGNGISHISVCYDKPDTPASQAPQSQAPESQAPESQAPESQAPESQAPESQAPESQAPQSQAAPSINEGVLGGNPTPAPTGGSLPDTAVRPATTVPATLLGLVLVAAIGVMLYKRGAAKR